MVAPLKKTMRRDRSRAARELDRRAAKLLRAAAWVARCPASLAWDARVGHGKVCEVVGDFDAVEALERAVAFFDGLHDASADDDDPEAAAWKALCRDVGDDAFGSTRDYARVALRALRDLRDLRDGSALDEDAHAEDADDVALADVADGDLSKRCRDFSSSVLEGGGSVGATLRQWHATAGFAVAPWHDDDEPPLRVGHDRRHALGRHAAVGGVRDARLGGAEALYWDSEDAALPLAAAATPNRPLAALRAALEQLRGADAASKFVSDEAIRLSGWGGRALKKKKKGPGLGHARPAKSALKNGAAPADDAPGREPPKLSAGICFFSLASPQELRGDFFSLVQEPLRLEPSTLALSPGPVTTTSCALGRPSRSTSVNAT